MSKACAVGKQDNGSGECVFTQPCKRQSECGNNQTCFQIDGAPGGCIDKNNMEQGGVGPRNPYADRILRYDMTWLTYSAYKF